MSGSNAASAGEGDRGDPVAAAAAETLLDDAWTVYDSYNAVAEALLDGHDLTHDDLRRLRLALERAEHHLDDELRIIAEANSESD